MYSSYSPVEVRLCGGILVWQGLFILGLRNWAAFVKQTWLVRDWGEIGREEENLYPFIRPPVRMRDLYNLTH